VISRFYSEIPFLKRNSKFKFKSPFEAFTESFEEEVTEAPKYKDDFVRVSRENLFPSGADKE
jgi:hypothetical protein